jgi:hypothetical protein
MLNNDSADLIEAVKGVGERQQAGAGSKSLQPASVRLGIRLPNVNCCDQEVT